MVGIVIVSHSKKLAEGVLDLIKMTSKEVRISLAGGLEDGSYGTSYDLISKAIDDVYSDDGVIVFADLGSSIMTTEMVVEDKNNDKIVLSRVAIVEGAFAASIYAESGLSLDEIISKIDELKIK